MPAYNAAVYIKDAIESLLKQSYSNWELVVIDDGSRDNTAAIVKSFCDRRIKYFYQTNRGVSAARNYGLQQIQGDFFCFLDADDVLPSRSIEVRLTKFAKYPHLAFVDGAVEARDSTLLNVTRKYLPRFKGNPMLELKLLSDSCFYGITWMVRRDHSRNYQFNPDVKYAEDLLFYLSISDQGEYDYVDELIYINRQISTSAMQNLKALAQGYSTLLPFLLRKYTYTFSEKVRLVMKVRVLIAKLLIRHFYNEQKARFNFRIL